MKSFILLLCLTLWASTAHAASASTAYSYDTLGRLVKVTYTNGATITYTYDAAGNRVQQKITCPTAGC